MDPSVSQQAYTSMMKFTMDGRPYVKDIHDLFGALMTQIRFETHRYLFRNYQNAFSSDDAIQVLGNLRFSQTVRVPDPNNPSRLIRTTTTTTFNMERDMARALCQQFIWARLMENAVDPQTRSFRDRGLWRLTLKGICILQEFCVRTEVDMPLGSTSCPLPEDYNVIRIERSKDDDQMNLNRQTLANVFRVMVRSLPLEGEHLEKARQLQQQQQHPEGAIALQRRESVASSTSSVSSSSTNPSNGPAPFALSSKASSVTTGTTISEKARLQLLDNRLLNTVTNMKRQHQNQQRKQQQPPLPPPTPGKIGAWVRVIFPTRMCCDWITENCTVANRDESEDIATEFYKLGWIEYQDPRQATAKVEAHKNVFVLLTSKGKQIPENAAEEPNLFARPRTHAPQPRPNSAANMDQQEGLAGRLKQILDDAQLRSLFKDFLHSNFCEENLDFWIDYATLRRKCRNQSPAMPSQNQKDLLEDAYSIWSSYLAPQAPNELNVDHTLRQEMARLVSATVTIGEDIQSQRVVISTHSTSQSLRMMLKWFDKVEEHILRLMASDSVPKFVRTTAYRRVMNSREQPAPPDRRDSGKDMSSEKEEVFFSDLHQQSSMAA
ncbi:regulator of G protein signaling domain-containing protein [Fennellomyces sp. T-0311]|nr:regulator of G protein signaling domain-containing protein [Fennellomyces sp. T-0311]